MILSCLCLLIFSIALAHNGIQNGDVMADPDMGIILNHYDGKDVLGVAQATHYQNDYVGIYQEAMRFEDGKLVGNEKLMKEQNLFLDQWTKNLIDQGFAENQG